MPPARRPRFAGLLGSLLLLIGVLSGCEPSCEKTCKKLLDCDLDTPRASQDDCESACAIDEKLYEDWEDTQLREDFADYKRCVKDETCADIEAGVCYDDDLYAF